MCFFSNSIGWSHLLPPWLSFFHHVWPMDAHWPGPCRSKIGCKCRETRQSGNANSGFTMVPRTPPSPKGPSPKGPGLDTVHGAGPVGEDRL